MSRLIWTPPALADVQRLYRFLAPKNADAAQRAVKAIRTGVKILAHQRHLGRPMDDMDGDYREWLISFGNSGYPKNGLANRLTDLPPLFTTPDLSPSASVTALHAHPTMFCGRA